MRAIFSPGVISRCNLRNTRKAAGSVSSYQPSGIWSSYRSALGFEDQPQIGFGLILDAQRQRLRRAVFHPQPEIRFLASGLAPQFAARAHNLLAGGNRPALLEIAGGLG